LPGLGGEEVVGLSLQGGADLVGPGADDDDDRAGPRPARRLDDVADHRPAADLVQHLGPLRLHPLAVAGRQDDRQRPLHRRWDCDHVRERSPRPRPRGGRLILKADGPASQIVYPAARAGPRSRLSLGPASTKIPQGFRASIEGLRTMIYLLAIL